MINPKINFPNLVRQNVPEHKRQTNRLLLFGALIHPLRATLSEFERWREDIRIQINMTGRVGVLEGYLRTKYNSTAIRIENYPEAGLAIGLRVEGVTHAVPVGMGPGTADGSVAAAVPIRGEVELQFEDADFVVYVPASFSDATIEAIRRDVDRFKQALVKYKIMR